MKASGEDNSNSKRFTTQYRRLLTTRFVKRLNSYGRRANFGRGYLLVCLTILLTTTLIWGVLGAILQQGNADQLVNAYLFQDGKTLQGAYFPGQHTFLIKWPLFFGVKLLGYTNASFIGLTLLAVLLTVGSLAYLLSRIEHRPLPLGTIYLALASAFLLVPAQPYAGALLPVNMSMLTTRNLEYIFYIASLYFIVRAQRLKSKHFVVGVILLGLLISSDKLFLSISLVGALLATIIYALRARWEFASLSVRWFTATVVSALGSIAIIDVINRVGLTHVVSSGPAGPYALIHSAKTALLGLTYAAGGVMTNFGANPAYNALTIRDVPQSIKHNILSVAGPAYFVNLVLLTVGIFVSMKLFLSTLGFFKPKRTVINQTGKLGTLLLWASISAVGLFVATDHYYVVDARYLTVSLFAVLVAVAGWARTKRLQPGLLLIFASLLLISIVSGSLTAGTNFQAQKAALQSDNARNQSVALTLASRHRVNLLVGDYWRVIPTRQQTGNRQQVLPLDACHTPRTVLTSQTWQPDLKRHSFAYLLTLDRNSTGYPSCSLRDVTDEYGTPNTSVLIAGSLPQPKELLLFYDQGKRISVAKTAGKIHPDTKSTVLPIDLADLPHTSCPVPTIINVVAHQDDDLLFMSPDLLHSIKSGECIRTVYLTAGDAGSGSSYWLSREQGSQAAYAKMKGLPSIWTQRIVRLPGGQFISVANLKGNSSVSLIFMHLPDGNLKGEGFGKQHESLAALENGRLKIITTVDKQSKYTADQLTAALVALFHTYQPAEIRTQSNYNGNKYKDHSDHKLAGVFASRAHKQYVSQQYAGYLTVPVRYYVGYPIHQFPPNVTGQDLSDKESAFMAYAEFDGSVCQSIEQCLQATTYGAYLARQYVNPR